MKFMYREELSCKEIFDNGFSNGYRRGDATKVAKYMRHILGYGDARIKTELIEFCKKHDPYFRVVPNRAGISKAIASSRKEFRDTSAEIKITKVEIDKIQRVKSFKSQKIMMAVLLMSKLKKDTKIWLSDWVVVRKIIHKNVTNKNISLCFNLYYEKGLVEVSHSAHTIKIESDTDKSPPAIIIVSDSDVYSLMRRYETYCGGVIRYCGVCGNKIEVTSNSRKYCDSCRDKKYSDRHGRYNKKRVTTNRTDNVKYG